MYQYSVVQWLFFFYFYCFFGWCFESAYVSVKNRHPVNRGFMRGPFLPLYGCGGIMMLLVSMPFQENIFLTYVAGCIGATVLEYVTGVIMEAFFKVRYWDYSDQKFNFQGHICLGSSMTWGVLTILMTEFLHQQVERFVFMIPEGILTIVTYVLTALIFADFALSFKAAMDLRDVLIQMEKARTEFMRIQKRLDVIIAVAGEEWTNRKEELTEGLHQRKEELTEGLQQRKAEWTEELQQRKENLTENILQRKADMLEEYIRRSEDISDYMEMKLEDLKASIETSLEKTRQLIQEKPADYPETLKQEMRDLFIRYQKNTEKGRNLASLKDFFQKDLIRSNPGMRSVKFSEALEELKKLSQTRKTKTPEETKDTNE